MSEAVLCLDTSVFIKFLTEEPPEVHARAAGTLVRRGLTGEARLVAPSFAWAEVGSVLRKKVRQRLVEPRDADEHWRDFLSLPIQFIEAGALRQRAWQVAARHDLPTLYDAVFLACTELAPAPEGSVREFWTADSELVRRLGSKRPEYVRELA